MFTLQPYHSASLPHHPVLIRDIANWTWPNTLYCWTKKYPWNSFQHNATSYSHCQLIGRVLNFLINSLCHQMIWFHSLKTRDHFNHPTPLLHSFQFRSVYYLRVLLCVLHFFLSFLIVLFALPMFLFFLSHFFFHCMLFLVTFIMCIKSRSINTIKSWPLKNTGVKGTNPLHSHKTLYNFDSLKI